eukprot:scaffold45158_cov161-Skeletonema_marinoi.AAC.2
MAQICSHTSAQKQEITLAMAMHYRRVDRCRMPLKQYNTGPDVSYKASLFISLPYHTADFDYNILSPSLLESPYPPLRIGPTADGVKEPARMGRDPEAPKNQEL